MRSGCRGRAPTPTPRVPAGRGPACVKGGDAKQAHVRWPVDELRAWKADPAAYVAPARDF